MEHIVDRFEFLLQLIGPTKTVIFDEMSCHFTLGVDKTSAAYESTFELAIEMCAQYVLANLTFVVEFGTSMASDWTAMCSVGVETGWILRIDKELQVELNQTEGVSWQWKGCEEFFATVRQLMPDEARVNVVAKFDAFLDH